MRPLRLAALVLAVAAAAPSARAQDDDPVAQAQAVRARQMAQVARATGRVDDPYDGIRAEPSALEAAKRNAAEQRAAADRRLEKILPWVAGVVALGAVVALFRRFADPPKPVRFDVPARRK